MEYVSKIFSHAWISSIQIAAFIHDNREAYKIIFEFEGIPIRPLKLSFSSWGQNSIVIPLGITIERISVFCKQS